MKLCFFIIKIFFFYCQMFIVFTFLWSLWLVWFATKSLFHLITASKRQHRLPVHHSSSRLGTVQIRELRVPLEYHEAFEVCRDVLRFIPGATLDRSSRDEGQIEASVGMTWRAWGARVRYELIPLEEEGTYVRLTIKPKLGTTAFDFGQSLDFIETLVAAIERRCARFIDTELKPSPAALPPAS